MDHHSSIWSAVTLTSSGGLIVYGITFQSIESFIGVCVALSTLCIMWIYKHLHYRLEKRRIEKELGE